VITSCKIDDSSASCTHLERLPALRLEEAHLLRVRAADAYLPELSLAEYVTLVRERHPVLSTRLAFDRPGADAALDALAATQNEFESDGTAGRGDSYRASQADPRGRIRGITKLLELALVNAPAGATLLDVLGGDGTIARATSLRSVRSGEPWHLITSDIAGEMVAAALQHGLPAIRQAAQYLFLADRSVDAVLLAYGTHHIPPIDRPRAVAEALRVLRPSGTLVIHDFEVDGPMARWFEDVVDPYSAAGHRYAHFSSEELRSYFDSDHFEDARVIEIYDPLVVRAATEEEAHDRLADHLAAMYGLVDIYGDRVTSSARERVWELAESIFVYEERAVEGGIVEPRVRLRRQGRFVTAELPRVALVGVGTRREDS
jgi:SAM-dependent methyltransferase